MEEDKNVGQAPAGTGSVRDAKAIVGDIKQLLGEKIRKAASDPQTRSAWKDFCNFKIMLFPMIVKWLWGLIFIFSFGLGSGQVILGIFHGPRSFILIGLLVILLTPIVAHLLLEFILLPFSTLDVLREIRDKERNR